MYLPSEDSYVLSEEITQYLLSLSDKEKKAIKILDMGTGSGIQAETCIKRGVPVRNITAADLDEQSLKYVRDKGLRTLYSNLFSDIKEKFDLILFNPPYLPEHPYDKNADTSGGKRGYETIVRFLKQAKSRLRKRGRIFLVISSLTKPYTLKHYAKQLNYGIQERARKKLFFEELFVWELKKNLGD